MSKVCDFLDWKFSFREIWNRTILFHNMKVGVSCCYRTITVVFINANSILPLGSKQIEKKAKARE